MDIMQFLSANKSGVFIAVFVLLLGSVGYFTLNKGGSAMGGAGAPLEVFDGLHLKVVWTDSGEPQLIAHARNNAMSRFTAAEGQPIPEDGSVVLGSMEGALMKKEGEYSKIGDSLKDFEGLKVNVGGVLSKTGTVVDRFHLLDAAQFNSLGAKQDVAYIKLSAEKSPKLFYTLATGDNRTLPSLKLAEGKLSDYSIQNLAGDKYYPLIVGSDEAKVMRGEKLFAKPGDTIRGFFGRNVYLVGVLVPAGNALDDMHFTPLGPNEWGG